MRSSIPWTRRRVLQTATSLTGLTLAAPLRAMEITPRPRYAYVGSAEGAGGIHVFACAYAEGKPHWAPVQQIPCLRPASLVLHPRGHVLYAANEIELDDGLPRGSVEAFAMDARTGTLTKLNRRPLSLSGTRPRHLAVSPCGSCLVAAAYGGGAYNTLPLARDGSLDRVSSMMKQTGAGPHPDHQRAAHPHSVLFDLSGCHLLASDLGADRLNVFAHGKGKLELIGRAALPPGSGPGQMSLDSSGQVLIVANHLQNSVSTFQYDPSLKDVFTPLHTTLLGEEGQSCSMFLDPSSRLLYTATVECPAPSSTVASWSVDLRTGRFSRLDTLDLPLLRLRFADAALPATRDGLYLLDERQGGIVHLPTASRTGVLGKPQRIAAVPQPRSLATL